MSAKADHQIKLTCPTAGMIVATFHRNYTVTKSEPVRPLVSKPRARVRSMKGGRRASN
jgi:hypothetical protein